MKIDVDMKAFMPRRHHNDSPVQKYKKKQVCAGGAAQASVTSILVILSP